MPDILCGSLLAKIEEQLERTGHLASLLPVDRLAQSLTNETAWTVSDLLYHLLDCVSGFCAVAAAVEPKRLAHFERLRDLPAIPSIGVETFLERLQAYREPIGEAFGLWDDDDLARTIPTVFVSGGETVLTLMLGNLEHLINHKRQLFEFLKRVGVQVGSADLYRFRG